MKILVLASRFPYPLEKGDKLRLFHQIRELSQQHDIVLCALHESAILTADFQQIKQFCTAIYTFSLPKKTIAHNILRGILRGGMPASVAYFFNKNIQKQIDSLIEKEQPDHLFCPLIRMAEYVKNNPLPKTLDYMDAFSIGMKRRAESAFLLRPFLRIESYLLKRFEARISAHFNHLTIISEQDRQHLDFMDKSKVIIVPNGVDTHYFKPQIPTLPQAYDIAFVGNLGYYPNVQAALFLVKNILPILKKQMPNIRILLAGARPSPDVLALQNEHITVKGWVEDIREAYASAKIFVAPIFHGSGQQNKILEAMAMQIPCVTTPMVNNAIKASPETDILIANTEGVFAEQIIRLLQNIDLQDTIKMNARKFVEENYSWGSSVKLLDKLIREEN